MKNIEKTLGIVIKNPKFHLRLILEGIMVGLLAGIMVSFYRFLLMSSESILYSILNFINGNILLILLWFIVLAIFGLITGLLMKWEPLASGSGIPQVNGEIKGYLNPSWWKILIAKTIGGTLSTLGGLSLGREGPSIQLGAMVAKGFSKIFSNTRTDEHRLILSGSGAGLSATFNAPLAGVIFTLEETHHALSESIVFVGIIAAIVADIVSKFFFGQSTIFSFASPNVPLNYYWLFILLGIILGFAGLIYNIGMIKASDSWNKFGNIPIEIRIIIAFIITGIVSLFLPQVLAGGHSMMNILKISIPTLSVLVLLLIAKYLLSVISFSSGAPGGIFFPLLVIGAYIGAIFSSIMVPICGLDPLLTYKFIIVSMAGMFASTVRAPLTGIILISEMTGSTNSLVALIIVTIIAYTIPNLLGNKPIYESLLERILKNRGMEKVEDSDNILAHYIVPLDCKLIGKEFKDVPFPETCLIVSINRDGSDMIVNDYNMTLKFGDELSILIDSTTFVEDNKQLEAIFYNKS